MKARLFLGHADAALHISQDGCTLAVAKPSPPRYGHFQSNDCLTNVDSTWIQLFLIQGTFFIRPKVMAHSACYYRCNKAAIVATIVKVAFHGKPLRDPFPIDGIVCPLLGLLPGPGVELLGGDVNALLAGGPPVCKPPTIKPPKLPSKPAEVMLSEPTIKSLVDFENTSTPSTVATGAPRESVRSTCIAVVVAGMA